MVLIGAYLIVTNTYMNIIGIFYRLLVQNLKYDADPTFIY